MAKHKNVGLGIRVNFLSIMAKGRLIGKRVLKSGPYAPLSSVVNLGTAPQKPVKTTLTTTLTAIFKKSKLSLGKGYDKVG